MMNEIDISVIYDAKTDAVAALRFLADDLRRMADRAADEARCLENGDPNERTEHVIDSQYRLGLANNIVRDRYGSTIAFMLAYRFAEGGR